jgi:pimeloyl-ACP methyl ester carboxylesterase
MRSEDRGGWTASGREAPHRRRAMSASIGLSLAVAVVVGAGCAPATETITTPAAASHSTGAGSTGSTVRFADEKVDVDGQQVAISCQGSGAKTVLFVGDVGQTGATGWDQSGVPAKVADDAVACTYDRPGLGRSDPGAQPRSIDNQVKDLDALVTAAALTTPLVLVGQGYGTFITRQFAKDHRASVSGMVLIDPQLWPFDFTIPPDASPGVKAEYQSLFQINIDLGRYGAGALPPPPVPTLVVGIDGAKPDLPAAAPTGVDLDGVHTPTTLDPLPAPEQRRDGQRQLAQKSPFGKFESLDDAGPYAQYWAPGDVVAAITSVLSGNAPKK